MTTVGLLNTEELEAKVFEALGTASTCWENLDGTGVFDSALAKKVGDELVKYILDRVWFTVEAIDKSPRLGMATTEELIKELIARLGQPVGNEIAWGQLAAKRTFDLAFMLGSLPPDVREYRTLDVI